jgi:hypothetical protein
VRAFGSGGWPHWCQSLRRRRSWYLRRGYAYKPLLSAFPEQPYVSLSGSSGSSPEIDPPPRKEEGTPYSVVRCEGAPCTRDGSTAEERGEGCLCSFMLLRDGSVGGGDGVTGIGVGRSWRGGGETGTIGDLGDMGRGRGRGRRWCAEEDKNMKCEFGRQKGENV